MISTISKECELVANLATCCEHMKSSLRLWLSVATSKAITKTLLIIRLFAAAAFLALILAGCSSHQFTAKAVASPALVNHSFSFDAPNDSRDQEILAFQYGLGTTPQTKNPFWPDQRDVRQFTNVSAFMPVGDSLYVRWVSKATGRIYEDLVDLRALLLGSMENRRLHFVVSEGQLLVFLIYPDPRPLGWPERGPRKYRLQKIDQIYP